MSVTFATWLFGGWQFGASDGNGQPWSARRKHGEGTDSALDSESAEQELLVRLRTGDAAAFESLYREHYLSVAKFAYLFVHSQERARDLAQDLFLAVWERRATLAIHGSIRPYLLSAVRRRALNALHRDRIDARVVDRTVGVDQPIGMGMETTAPDRGAEEALLARTLQQVFERMPERQRTAFLLRWEQGLSNQEIALVLGIGKSAVSRLMDRVTASFRELIERVM